MTIEYFVKNWRDIDDNDISFNWGEWVEISKYKYLEEEFIDRYRDEVDWFYVSFSQELSEEFIDKHEDKLNWGFISWKQKLSVELAYKHRNKIEYLNCLSDEKHYDDIYVSLNYLLYLYIDDGLKLHNHPYILFLSDIM